MEYKIYKLKFGSAVHFGNGTLDSSGYSFGADTLFSALCIEALKYGKSTLEELVQMAISEEVCFSDAFPYIDNVLFLPKPVLKVRKEAETGDSTLKKAFKKLQYIPCEEIDNYLRGDFDVRSAPDMNRLGAFDMKVSVSIRGEEKTEPYRVSSFSFHDGCGLYIIVGYQNDEQLYLVEDLLMSLSYSGIGGKRTAGYGRFELFQAKIPTELVSKIGKKKSCQMLLSSALPKDEEMEHSLEGASYRLIKKSGFVASENYAESQLRKRDIYMFASGSCFKDVFHGDLYDVSTSEGTHPVYRYAKPLFMGVDV